MGFSEIFSLICTMIVVSECQLPIENSVIGDPQIECLSHMVSVKFQSQNPFQGHVFVRGHYNTDDCHKDYILNRDNSGFMDVPFEKCGMRRQRSANPKGMTMSATIVVSFHRTFITHVDRAYHIECFYLEEEKVVTQNLEVSVLPTTDLDMRPPMPTCFYEVLATGPDGTAVKYARVGDRVFHKWTCDYPMPDMYCMLVHSCTVDDGEKAVYQGIDEKGCVKDIVLLSDINYATDLMAGAESAVFKFADKAHVYFTCQIKLSLKTEHENAKCPRPQCEVVPIFEKAKRLRRRRRNSSNRLSTSEGELDVVANPVLVLDLDDPSRITESGSRLPPPFHPVSYLPKLLAADSPVNGVCLSELSFGVLVAAALLSCLTATMFTLIYCIRMRKDL